MIEITVCQGPNIGCNSRENGCKAHVQVGGSGGNGSGGTGRREKVVVSGYLPNSTHEHNFQLTTLDLGVCYIPRCHKFICVCGEVKLVAEKQ